MIPITIRPARPEPAEADPLCFATGLLCDFYRDVRPADWRNRALPRLRRWCHPIDFPLPVARRSSMVR